MAKSIAVFVLALFLAVAAQAEARIDVAIDGTEIDLTMVDAAPADALAQLASRLGFVLDGADGLPRAPMSLHVRRDLSGLIGLLTGPASHVALYDAADPMRLVRLVLLSTGGRQPTLEIRSTVMPGDLPPGDPALGASRIGADVVRASIRERLGLALP
jgi:hypothetical protein